MFFSIPSRLAWFLAAMAGIIDIIWMALGGFSIELREILLDGALIGFLFAGGWYFYHWRGFVRGGMLVISFAFLMLFAVEISIMSYLAASAAYPLIDADLAGLDRFIGFDWPAWTEFIARFPLVEKLLVIAYSSSLIQVLLAAVLLALLGRHERLNRFVLLFMLTAISAALLSSLFPAAGAYHYFADVLAIKGSLPADTGLWHMEHFNALRDGSMRVLDLANIEGLVTFPSFHTCLALISTYAVWRIKYVFWPVAGLNFIVLISTLSVGGHHLVDVIAGAGVVLCSWLLIRLYYLPRPITVFGFTPLSAIMLSLFPGRNIDQEKPRVIE